MNIGYSRISVTDAAEPMKFGEQIPLYHTYTEYNIILFHIKYIIIYFIVQI